ncbi:polyprenol monophosphomannose synthase [bacterium]|nr:polyprenol monophosphomannose synthase [bacterium]
MKAEQGAILIPTYEERENIGGLIDKIRDISQELTIIVIDDNSPDNTEEVVRQKQKVFKNLHLISREKKLGLGAAYIHGMKEAISMGFDFIITMDSDFSHDPEVIPDMILALQNSDAVVGSRYVKGGGIKNWPVHRKLMSAAANLLLRLILKTRVKDSTSGYRCIRTKLLKKISYSAIRSQGYSFLYEMLYKMRQAGARITEIPIIFIDRKFGFTKISKTEIYKALLSMFRLRFSRLP